MRCGFASRIIRVLAKCIKTICEKMPEAASRIPEIVVLEPRDLSETSLAIQALRSRKVVILKLTNLESDQAQRAADFVTGGTYAIDGHTEWIGERTFLFTPSGVQVVRQSCA